MASRSPLDQLDSRSNRHPVPSGSITASIARQRRIGGRKKFPWTSSANGQTTSSSFRRRRTATSSTRSRHRNPHYLLPHGCQAPRAHVLNPLHRSHNTLLQHPSPRFELYGPRQRIRMSRSPSKKKLVEVAVVNVSSCDTNPCPPFDSFPFVLAAFSSPLLGTSVSQFASCFHQPCTALQLMLVRSPSSPSPGYTTAPATFLSVLPHPYFACTLLE